MEKNSKVKQIDRFPIYYSKVPFLDKIFFDRYKISLELAKIKNSSTILDIGYARGFLLKIISRLYPSCKRYGIDVNDEFISKLSSLGCNLKVADATNLPFGDGFFDVVFALDVLEHIQDMPKAIKEIHRVLKKDGLAILSGPTESWFYRLCRLVAFRKITLEDHKYDIFDIEKEFEKQNFNLVKRKSLPRSPIPELFRISEFRKIPQN